MHISEILEEIFVCWSGETILGGSVYANMHLFIFTHILYIVFVQINNILYIFIAFHGYITC